MTEHTVVLGAGLAGLLAAAAAADVGHDVTIVERDRLPDSPTQRRGVPQGSHLHSLLSHGWQVIEQLVPGVIGDLVTAGAHVLDDAHLGARMHIQNGPYAFNRTDPLTDPAALTTYLVTRPLLEYQLRRRVERMPNVTIEDGHDVGELVAAQGNRITGVTISGRHTGVTRTLRTDLVIDATGRGTRTPLLLKQLGYEPPPQRTFTVHGVYYSQHIAIPDQHVFDERLVLVVPASGAGRGGLIAGERDVWTLTIATHADERSAPPSTLAEMLTRAAGFVPPHIHRALQQAQPLSDVTVHRYPGGAWHRYDRCTRLPNGLVVLGDALCCLDPINGQGVTLAAMHVEALHAQLRMYEHVDPQHFYRSLTAVIAPVWAANQPPGTAPARGLVDVARRRVLRWVQRKVLEAAGDIVVTERLVRIVNMVDPPQRLLEPRLLTHVLVHHLRRALPTPGTRDRRGTEAHARQRLSQRPPPRRQAGRDAR